MKEVVPEVLLVIQVCHPSWALELNLIEGPLQPSCKGGNLLIVSLAHLIKILHKHVEWGHYATDNPPFLQGMVDASHGSHLLSHIHNHPL